MIRTWTPAARAYHLAVVAVGCGVLVLALVGLVGELEGGSLAWILLLLAAPALGLLAYEVASERTYITPSETLAFLSILLYGPSLAALAGGAEAYATVRRLRPGRFAGALFSGAAMVISLFLAGHVYHWSGGVSLATTTVLDMGKAVAPLLAMAATHLLVNTGLVIFMVRLHQGRSEPLLAAWWREYGFAAVTYLCSASLAALVALAAGRFGWGAVVVALPLLAGILTINRMHGDQQAAELRRQEEVSAAYRQTLFTLARAIDARDQITRGHVFRVREIANQIGLELKLPETTLEALTAAALLHDVGKLAVPDHLLDKRGSLSEFEMLQLRTHPVVGAELLAGIRFPGPVLPAVRHHHESWDGSGYPDGLAGETIPLMARILALADQYDALRCRRPYTAGLTPAQALAILKRDAGRQFDPRLVAALERCVAQVETRMSASGEAEQGESRVFGIIAETRRRSQALHEALLEIGASLDLSTTYEALARHLDAVFPGMAGVIYLTGDRGRRLEAAFAWGPGREALIGRCLALGNGVAGGALSRRTPVLNADPSLDLVGVDPELSGSLLSAAAFPLVASEGNVEGVVALYARRRDAFSPDQAQWMVGLARKAAEALRNARAYSEVQATLAGESLSDLPADDETRARVQAQVARCRELGSGLALLVVRLHGLSEVEARSGRAMRQRVLHEIAGHVRRQAQPGDFLGRLGVQDTLLLACETLDRRDAESLAARVEEEVRALRCVIGPGQIAGATPAVGLACLPLDGREFPVLLERALAQAESRGSRPQPPSGAGVVNLRLIGPVQEAGSDG